jgi:hypothetical protein
MNVLTLYNESKKANVAKNLDGLLFVECFIDNRVVQKLGPYYNIDYAKDIAENFVSGSPEGNPHLLTE